MMILKFNVFRIFQNQPTNIHPRGLCLAKIEDFFELLQNFTKRCETVSRIFWCNMQGRVIYLRVLRAIVRGEVFRMKISVFHCIESSECSIQVHNYYIILYTINNKQQTIFCIFMNLRGINYAYLCTFCYWSIVVA